MKIEDFYDYDIEFCDLTLQECLETMDRLRARINKIYEEKGLLMTIKIAVIKEDLKL